MVKICMDGTPTSPGSIGASNPDTKDSRSNDIPPPPGPSTLLESIPSLSAAPRSPSTLSEGGKESPELNVKDSISKELSSSIKGNSNTSISSLFQSGASSYPPPFVVYPAAGYYPNAYAMVDQAIPVALRESNSGKLPRMLNLPHSFHASAFSLSGTNSSSSSTTEDRPQLFAPRLSIPVPPSDFSEFASSLSLYPPVYRAQEVSSSSNLSSTIQAPPPPPLKAMQGENSKGNSDISSGTSSPLASGSSAMAEALASASANSLEKPDSLSGSVQVKANDGSGSSLSFSHSLQIPGQPSSSSKGSALDSLRSSSTLDTRPSIHFPTSDLTSSSTPPPPMSQMPLPPAPAPPTLRYSGFLNEVMPETASDPVSQRIRVWLDTENRLYYDCFCGKRKPIRNLKGIKHHCSRHDTQVFKCEMCDRVFHHYLGLNSHRKAHREDDSKVTGLKSGSDLL